MWPGNPIFHLASRMHQNMRAVCAFVSRRQKRCIVDPNCPIDQIAIWLSGVSWLKDRSIFQTATDFPADDLICVLLSFIYNPSCQLNFQGLFSTPSNPSCSPSSSLPYWFDRIRCYLSSLDKFGLGCQAAFALSDYHQICLEEKSSAHK